MANTPNQNDELLGWSADSKHVFAGTKNKTLYSIYKLSITGKEVKEWSNTTDYISLPSLNKTSTHFSFVLQNPAKPAEVYISPSSIYKPVKISYTNEAISSFPVPKTEVINWKSSDGKIIEGLITYPLHYEPGKKYPLVVNIHGGPANVYSQTFIVGSSILYQIATLAEKGIMILRPNPRGSDGYGSDFRQAITRDWGGVDYQDIMTGVNHVIQLGLADSSKLGVMGWSYGGYMAAWIVSQTNRFKAASVGAPIIDMVSTHFTHDILGNFSSYMQKQPWEDWNIYNTRSPIRYLQNINTPVLLQHGDADIRVPFSQGVMFYNALKSKGVPVRFLVLPRQPHIPYEPKQVLRMMQTNLAWFDHYLNGNQLNF